MSGRAGISVVIAGAGALGSCLALALSRAGARVTLVDPGATDNASSVAAGMIAPVFETLLDGEESPPFTLLEAAAGLWGDLAASIGLSLDRRGALAVGVAEDLDRWEALARAAGAPCERLGREAAEAAAEGLSAPAGGLYSALDVRLEPRAALATLGKAMTAEVRRARVVKFSPGRLVLDNGETVVADALVVATGAGADLTRLAPELAGLTPIKGHILRLAGGPRSGPVVRMAQGYVCPALDGAMAGASMEVGRADLTVDEAVVRGLLAQSRAAFPTLDTVVARAMVGVRAATLDGLPLAGRSSTPGVWIAAGARRNGWLLAPLIAQVLTKAMMDDADLPPGLVGLDPRRHFPVSSR